MGRLDAIKWGRVRGNKEDLRRRNRNTRGVKDKNGMQAHMVVRSRLLVMKRGRPTFSVKLQLTAAITKITSRKRRPDVSFNHSSHAIRDKD